MVCVAARSERGVALGANEDACCIKVAMTPLGEVAMAVVCDGVGGLTCGDLASSTVVRAFSQWFDETLPELVAAMPSPGHIDLGAVRLSWGALLARLNDAIAAYGSDRGLSLATTFTGVFARPGCFLVAHVGDCRAYRLDAEGLTQVTDDQTLAARMHAFGEVLPSNAQDVSRNAIMQAVGAQPVVQPVFYGGKLSGDDLLIVCSDGAYRKVGNEGVHTAFEAVDRTDEQTLEDACDVLLRRCISAGETDNLTVACVSGALRVGMLTAPDDSSTQSDGTTEALGSAGFAGAGAPNEQRRVEESVAADDAVTEVSAVLSSQAESDVPTVLGEG